MGDSKVYRCRFHATATPDEYGPCALWRMAGTGLAAYDGTAVTSPLSTKQRKPAFGPYSDCLSQ